MSKVENGRISGPQSRSLTTCRFANVHPESKES